jgi:hypothetical protein
MGRHHSKTVVVVEVVDVVIVAAGTARVPLIIVEGTAAQHTGVSSQPRHSKATRLLYFSMSLGTKRSSPTIMEGLLRAEEHRLAMT